MAPESEEFATKTAPGGWVRAAILREFGSPNGVVVESWPEPLAGPGEAVVRVRAVCVNRTDLHVINRTNIGRSATVPHIGGLDPAGEVVAVGVGVTNVAVGDNVVARPMIPCLDCRFCTSARESMCERPTYIGVHRAGGFAEFVALPARALYPLPTSVDIASAAAMAHSVPIGLHLLSTVGSVGPADTVLVIGAAGGLGSACVQIAHHLGARVLAASRGDVRTASVRALGADVVLNYEDPGTLTADVRRETGGTGATVAVDNIGDPSLWPHVVASLDKGGRVLSAGSHAGAIMPLDLPLFYRMQLRLLATAGFSDAEFRAALDLVASGAVTPVVHAEYPLERIRDALVDLAERRNVGKLVIRVA
jgi:NADPH:quinone reductase-like Zn-dependent oxidoreductase